VTEIKLAENDQKANASFVIVHEERKKGKQMSRILTELVCFLFENLKNISSQKTSLIS
jgi:hypothetical protein